jgi:DNA invertase Pin-like site-specific DNA recombinase
MRVMVVTQDIDLRGAVGRLVASVLFGLAEIATEYRRERQAVGVAVANDRGVDQGRRKGTTKAQPTVELGTRGDETGCREAMINGSPWDLSGRRCPQFRRV